MTSLRVRHVVAIALGVAVVSMWLAPATLNFDPWGWLVWGREVTSGSLDTTGGPSWKPLPVVVTTPLSWLGDGAPGLWMVIARAGGVLTAVAVAMTAARVIGTLEPGPKRDRDRDRGAERSHRPGVVAAVAAAAFLVLTPDPEPRWIRTVLEGHSAPLSAGLTTWAIERHLAGRTRWAWAAAVAASLLRPEVWPFLGVYGLWLLWDAWSGGTSGNAAAGALRRRAVVVVASWAGIAVAWFGGDYWGSGSLWHGAEVAQVGPRTLSQRWSLVVEVSTEMVPPIVWLLALVAVGLAVSRLRRDPADAAARRVVAMAGLALAWVGVIAALTLGLGYAAISRFLLPAAALSCVLAGVGLAAGVTVLDSRRLRAVLAVALVATGAASASRVTGLATVWNEVADRSERAADLDAAVAAAVDAVGRDRLVSCGKAVITEPGLRAHLAWSLELPMHETGARSAPVTPSVTLVGRNVASTPDWVGVSGVTVAKAGYWRVVLVGCEGRHG